MKIAVLQPNYLPWKGYFDLIASSDVCVILDNVQYTKNDWRNRNVIKSSVGLTWLTVPISTKNRFGQQILDAEILGNGWQTKHARSLEVNYRRAQHFDEVYPLICSAYDGKVGRLVDLNQDLLQHVCAYVGIETPFIRASELSVECLDATERLIGICRRLGAKQYFSGPAAKAYLNEDKMSAANISVKYMSYDNYPTYPQLYGSFVHKVSIVDLLFNCGPSSSQFMKFTN